MRARLFRPTRRARLRDGRGERRPKRLFGLRSRKPAWILLCDGRLRTKTRSISRRPPCRRLFATLKAAGTARRLYTMF